MTRGVSTGVPSIGVVRFGNGEPIMGSHAVSLPRGRWSNRAGKPEHISSVDLFEQKKALLREIKRLVDALNSDPENKRLREQLDAAAKKHLDFVKAYFPKEWERFEDGIAYFLKHPKDR
jgi:hypothetical protein